MNLTKLNFEIKNLKDSTNLERYFNLNKPQYWEYTQL